MCQNGYGDALVHSACLPQSILSLEASKWLFAYARKMQIMLVLSSNLHGYNLTAIGTKLNILTCGVFAEFFCCLFVTRLFLFTQLLNSQVSLSTEAAD